MNPLTSRLGAAALALPLAAGTTVSAQIGRRFPAETKVVIDPVTGVPLTFPTTQAAGDSKIYQTHHQWTADGNWLVFRFNRVPAQAMAVNEETGDLVQVAEGGFTGMLCVADHSMNRYFLRIQALPGEPATPPADTAAIVSADRQTDELILLSADHKRTAADHPHPTFNADSTRIQIQSAMLSADGRSMNICIIPVPEKLLTRTYGGKVN